MKFGILKQTVLLIVLLCNVCFGAIIEDTTGTATTASTSATIADNPNSILLLHVGDSTNSLVGRTCTYNGSSMTQQAGVVWQFDSSEVFAIASPDAGTHTISCNANIEIHLAWASLYNVDNTAPESICTGNNVGTEATCTPPTVSEGSILFGGFKLDRPQGSPIAGSGLTLLNSSSSMSSTAYGIGATVWTITNITSTGQKLKAVVSYAVAPGLSNSYICNGLIQNALIQ